ncbi:hypothetical protein LINPERHAP1_LOCUS40668, partial [Linum perenne]
MSSHYDSRRNKYLRIVFGFFGRDCILFSTHLSAPLIKDLFSLAKYLRLVVLPCS